MKNVTATCAPREENIQEIKNTYSLGTGSISTYTNVNYYFKSENKFSRDIIAFRVKACLLYLNERAYIYINICY